MFDNVEYPPDTDLDEQIPDLFLNLIISFNMQFTDESENPVLAALEDKDVAKTFTEKILLLINREGKLFISCIVYFIIIYFKECLVRGLAFKLYPLTVNLAVYLWSVRFAILS